jgi:hypothetical protein
MCRNVVLRVTEPLHRSPSKCRASLFYTGRGFIPSLSARVFTPTFKIIIGLKFLQVKVEDFPQGRIDGDRTGSLLTFGGSLPESDRRSHIVDGQLQCLRYPAAGVETDAKQTSIPIVVETGEQTIQFRRRENLGLSVTLNFHDTYVLLVKRKLSSSIMPLVARKSFSLK